MRVLALLVVLTPAPADAGSVDRAVAYLAEEVPRWSRENGCFSCHNNGDGARALLAAARSGRTVPQDALADTRRWLRQPEAWKTVRTDPAFSDKKLARLQFAAALADEPDRDAATRAAFSAAARLLAQDQAEDGSWGSDTDAVVGSPVTYGRALATWTAVRVLEATGGLEDRARRAREWLRRLKPASNLEAAVALMALPAKERTLPLVRAQSSDGGFGPFAGAPSEAFDTAVVLLALATLPKPERPAAAMDRARAYLESTQLPGGGWPETTRPSGGRSYAQHVSTTAWVVRALIAMER